MSKQLKLMMLIGKSVSTGEPVYELVGFDPENIHSIAPAIFEYASRKLNLIKIEFINSDVVYVKEKMQKFKIFKQIKNGK
jgi:hypothetical protein